MLDQTSGIVKFPGLVASDPLRVPLAGTAITKF